jgi:hypothetical protein
MIKKTLDRILAIESVLIELSRDNAKPWSSRVQADRIYALAHGKSKEKVKKPWEHFAIGKLP